MISAKFGKPSEQRKYPGRLEKFMLKKEFLPLAIFALLVLWVTGSWGMSFLEKDDEPDTVAVAASATPSISPTPTVTDTPTRSPSATPTFTPSRTNTPRPTFTPSPTVTPTPVPSNTPTPKPTRNRFAGTVIKNSTMRVEANEASAVVDIAYVGAVFNLLVGDQDEEWIKINIGNEKIGWVRTENVEIDVETGEVIGTVTPSATPTPDEVPTFLISGDDSQIIERSLVDRLETGQQRWYTFSITDQNKDRNITLLVRPITNKVSFAIYTERQYELYRYEDINAPSIEEIGQVDTRLEKDWINWIGNLTADSRYFFRIVNNDQHAIEYCLVPLYMESWAKCP